LGSVIFSLLVPFATLTVPNTEALMEAVEPILYTGASIENIVPISIKKSFDYSLLFMGIYGFVSLILLLRFGKNVFKIIRKIKANKKIQHQTATLVLVEDNILPHSFWNAIFINKSEFEQGTIETELFTHELTHVTQKHTLDIVLIEMLHILFWINPLFIFLKNPFN
jgi:beta-lactamase regulating signal transducer with metallopeptidase domain